MSVVHMTFYSMTQQGSSDTESGAINFPGPFWPLDGFFISKTWVCLSEQAEHASSTHVHHSHISVLHPLLKPQGSSKSLLSTQLQSFKLLAQRTKEGFEQNPSSFSWQNHAMLTSPICFPVFVIQGWLKTLEEQKERMKMEVLQRKIGIPLLSWKKCVQGY